MSRRKRPSRERRFGEVVVSVARDGGPEGVGSRVMHGEHVYELPHWPARFQSITEMSDGGLAVAFTDGSQRMLDPRFDAVALAESATDELSEADHGKLRYVVRALKDFDLVEVAQVRGWLQMQAAGATKWGSAEPAKLTEDARPRMGAGLPKLTPADIDALAEFARSSGVEPSDVLGDLVEAANVPNGLTFADSSDTDGSGPSPVGDDGDDETPQNCGTCQYFVSVGADPDGDGDMIGNCSLYDWPVDDTLVCTSWAPDDDSNNPAVNVDTQGGMSEADADLTEMNYHNLGPSGKPRNVEAMTDQKLDHLSKHPNTHPELRKRVRREKTLRTQGKHGHKHKVGMREAASISAKQREKHATVTRDLPGGGKKHMFPIFNEQSARSALHLINHSDLTPHEKAKVRRRAAQYVTPKEVSTSLERTYELIFEADAALSAACIADTLAEMRWALSQRAAAEYPALMERWLALHGDAGRVREDAASIEIAMGRALSEASDADPKPRTRSEVERRVVEAQRGVYEPAAHVPQLIAESHTRSLTATDVFADDPEPLRTIPTDILANLPREREIRSAIREATADAPGESFSDTVIELAARPIEELQQRAGELYAATGGATAQGYKRIRESSSLQLATMIEDWGSWDEKRSVGSPVAVSGRGIGRIVGEHPSDPNKMMVAYKVAKPQGDTETIVRGHTHAELDSVAEHIAQGAGSDPGRDAALGIAEDRMADMPLGHKVVNPDGFPIGALGVARAQAGRSARNARWAAARARVKEAAEPAKAEMPSPMDSADSALGMSPEGPLHIGAKGRIDAPGPDKRDDRSEDERLDSLLAIAGDSYRRFQAAYQANVDRMTPPPPQRAAVPLDDAPVPAWAQWQIGRSPAMESAREAAQAALRG